jgi:hypothetical protein
VFLSRYHGNWFSRLIAKFQGAGGSAKWSHTGVYIGRGFVAEATFPKGGIRPLSNYLGKKHDMEMRHPFHWTRNQRNAIASEAARLAPMRYDWPKMARHLIDNVFERITWNGEKGWRPLSRLFRLDVDGEKANVCSELVQRAVYYGSGEKLDGGEMGTARPLDIANWLNEKIADSVVAHKRGRVE